MDGWNTNFVLGWPIFQVRTVSLPSCNALKRQLVPPGSVPWPMAMLPKAVGGFYPMRSPVKVGLAQWFSVDWPFRRSTVLDFANPEFGVEKYMGNHGSRVLVVLVARNGGEAK